MSWFSDVVDFIDSDLGGNIVEGAFNVAGDLLTADANNRAAEAGAAATRRAGEILNEGYDAQLDVQREGYDTLRDINDSRLLAMIQGLEAIPDEYGDNINRGVGFLAQQYGLGADAFADGLRTGNQLFADGLNASSDRYDATIQAGVDEYGRQMLPYTDAGEEAVSQLMKVMALPADSMTPSQLRARDNYVEAARANLAASGLRGAGRAGVATVNEGLAALDAAAYDQNQSRIDQAMQTLGSMGLSASGSVANNQMRGQELMGSNRSANDRAIATNARDVETAIGENRFGINERVGTAGLNANEAIAQNTANTRSDTVGTVGDYYDRTSGLAANEINTESGTIMGKAGATAGAESTSGYLQAQAGLANAGNWGSGASYIGQIVASGARPTKYADANL